MSYQKASECFDHVRVSMGHPGNDVTSIGMWDLSVGLANLTAAIAADAVECGLPCGSATS